MSQEKTDKYQILIEAIKEFNVLEEKAEKANDKKSESQATVKRLITELGNKHDGFFFAGRLYTANGNLNIQENIVNLENPPTPKTD